MQRPFANLAAWHGCRGGGTLCQYNSGDPTLSARNVGGHVVRGVVGCLEFVSDDFGQLPVDGSASKVDDVEEINARLVVAPCTHRLVVVIYSVTQPYTHRCSS